MKSYITSIAIVLTLLSATGCGGGSSGTSATTSPPSQPTQPAYTCPAGSAGAVPSYGTTTLIATCPTVFTDPTLNASTVADDVNAVASARATDLAFYGTLQSTIPDVLFCDVATACGTTFAGSSDRNVTLYPGSEAGTWIAPRLSVVLPDAGYARNQYVLAHEFSHVEVYARMNGNIGGLPAWFNEGLATYVGGEPDCTGVTITSRIDLTQYDNEATWTAWTNTQPNFNNAYCQARAEVAAWVAVHGASGVENLMGSVAAGQSFYAVYGSLLTQ
jgi:hypothetical protein